MTDYDATLGAAVASAAGATVTPPFGAVERRARARRHRQVAAVAFATVVVAGAAALAAPGGTPRGGVTPIAPSLTPEAAPICPGLLIVPDLPPRKKPPVADRPPCVVARDVETAETAKCWSVPEPGDEAVLTVGSGDVGKLGWYVVAWPSDGTRCVSFQMDPAGEPLTPDSDMDSGPDGALRPLISWDLLVNNGRTTATIWWGALPPEVVRVEWVVGGTRKSYATVDGGDRRYLGVVLAYPKGTKRSEPVGYDARGRRVTLPDPSP